MNTILRVFVTILLALAGLVGLGMSLCGGMITFAGLTEAGHAGEFRASDMLVMSVPSLLAGLAIVVGVVRVFVRRARGSSPPADRPGRER